jgi:N6-adenosine-specific RNA methylase IME4
MTDLLKDLQGQKFRTICADPPWEVVRSFGGANWRNGQRNRPALDYPTMTLAEIEAMPVAGVADKDAHLYLWTVGRYLEVAPSVARAWGFRVVNTLVWCKRRGGFVGGAYFPNVEFCLFCRRGKLPTQRRVNSQWFEWPRGRHSAKPEAFQDMVETVSPGPRLELFARRERPGWVTIGNEADGMDVKDSLILLAQGKHPCYGVEKHRERSNEKTV